MLRVVAIVVILLGAGFAYEEITGDQIGIKATMQSLAAAITSMVGGSSSPAFGGLGGLGG